MDTQAGEALTLQSGLVAGVDADVIFTLVVALAGLLRFRLILELVDGLTGVLLGLVRDVGVLEGGLEMSERSQPQMTGYAMRTYLVASNLASGQRHDVQTKIGV